jgi:hypothetical protein
VRHLPGPADFGARLYAAVRPCLPRRVRDRAPRLRHETSLPALPRFAGARPGGQPLGGEARP